MRTEQVSDEELAVTKQGFIERFPRSFASKAQIVGTFANDEYTGRYASNPNYWKEVRARVAAVGKEDILRVARKYLTPEALVILVVGQKDEILLGHPDHAVKLTELTAGDFTELPLRDPMTMQPIISATDP